MKKSLIALAALAATSAFAQSTVTISGRMDALVRYTAKVAPGAANYSITEDGGANTIRFAVVEDLGGGMRAVGDVGMRFGIIDGLTQSSGARPLFQGETRVGVAGGFGTIKIGRGLTAVQGPLGLSEPFSGITAGAARYAPGFATDYAAGGEARIDQAVFYNSPNMGGINLGLSWSPKKLSSTTATSSPWALTTTSTKTHLSLYANYTAGPLSVSAGHEQNRVGDKMTPIWASYDAGVARIFAHYNTVKGGTAADRTGVTFAAASSAITSGAMGTATVGVPANTAAGVAANGEIKAYGIGALIPMGANSLRLGYSTWNGNGSAGQKDDTKLAFGVRHDLSKRTFLQANIASETRKNQTGTRPDRDNTKQTTWEAGVVHSF